MSDKPSMLPVLPYVLHSSPELILIMGKNTVITCILPHSKNIYVQHVDTFYPGLAVRGYSQKEAGWKYGPGSMNYQRPCCWSILTKN